MSPEPKTASPPAPPPPPPSRSASAWPTAAAAAAASPPGAPVASAGAARDRTLTESRLTVGDLASLRDQLAVESSSAEEAGSTVRHMAARLAEAEAAAAAGAARGAEGGVASAGARAINWTSREDGLLLLLGMHLHGMGHWDKVAADEARSADRGLADKLA
ncbi:Centrosomal protein 135kDa [Pleodorina starrii]|nr:Centrosomal protein 135kDa [Pleodorina starrii]